MARVRASKTWATPMPNKLNPLLSKRKWLDGHVYYHYCPGCNTIHGIWTEQTSGPNWTFNGNMEKPTFTPSVRCMGGQNQTTCHYFVTDGIQKFCPDSPHALAGQEIPLYPLPDWVVKEEKESPSEEA